ncbi:lytic transglycosylase domain-containing protein [Salmonella enterica]
MQIIFKKLTIFALTLSFSPITLALQRECINEAAQCFQINPLVIKAIIWQESNNRQDVINQNKNNTRDIGMMQINSIHLQKLKKMGISEQQLRENSCVNVFSGAWVLNNAIQRYGYTWEGIGNYHSATPMHHNKYVNNLTSIIAHKLQLIKNIQVNYQAGIREKFTCK